VDDLRESPAIEVAHLLKAEGAWVSAFEPYKPEASLEGLTLSSTLEGAMQEADAVVLLVGHCSLRELNPAAAAGLMQGRVAVDCVNGWDRGAWETAGFHYSRLGGGR
jgi:UDP-N-acetyl-D-mannosaminuronate dehydrogenase